jgi:hypothetical protein
MIVGWSMRKMEYVSLQRTGWILVVFILLTVWSVISTTQNRKEMNVQLKEDKELDPGRCWFTHADRDLYNPPTLICLVSQWRFQRLALVLYNAYTEWFCTIPKYYSFCWLWFLCNTIIKLYGNFNFVSFFAGHSWYIFLLKIASKGMA